LAGVLKFENAEVLREKIQEYFESCFEEYWEDVEDRDENGEVIMQSNGKTKMKHVKRRRMIEVPTKSALAVFIGTTRQTLNEYGGTVPKENRDKKGGVDKAVEFRKVVSDAYAQIHAYTEQKLFGKGHNPSAIIFTLKNNFGWNDKKEVDIKMNKIGELLDDLDKLDE